MLNKKYFIKYMQMLIIIGMGIFLYERMNLHKMRELIQHATLHYLLLALALLIVQMTMAAYRWRLLLRLNGFSLPVWPCIGSFAASSFINTTLPVSIGGDLMRVWVARQHGMSATISIHNVLLDRIISTVSLALLVFVTQLLYLGATMPEINMFALLLASILLGVFMGLMWIAPMLKYSTSRLLSVFFPFNTLSQMTLRVMQQPLKVLCAFFMVVYASHFLLLLAIILLVHGLHIGFTFYQAFISIPVVMLFSAVPITPGSWGIREGAMLLVLRPFGVPAEMAVSVSVLYGIGSILGSIPAAMGWSLYKNRVRKAMPSYT